MCSRALVKDTAIRKKKSRMLSDLTFVFGLSLLRLNRQPSVRCLMSSPSLLSLKASVSMDENMRLNSVGARTQTCLTPFVTGKGLEASPFSWTQACMPYWKCLTIAINLFGQPYLAIILHRPSLQTVSKAFIRSKYRENRSIFCFWHFSCNRLVANITFFPETTFALW